ncbi:MAG: HU family DNA-binding protein [Muribaculaceae bacterium]|nr:HU family DNA-binding protein [Muribaculaceae bacterium]
MDNQTFITRLSRRLNSSPNEVSQLVEALVTTFSRTAADVDSIAIPGFGTFQPVKTMEHIDTLPSGKQMLMPPSITMTFKESVLLRKKLQNSPTL